MDHSTHEANRRHWNAASASWAQSADRRGLWQRCPRQPELALDPRELAHLGDVSGREVCVLGSGDNEVVFALAGMGARVTSVDIAERQLEVAAQRAELLGLNLTFVRADVTALHELADASFDLVYTGGHVGVWVSDLSRYYAEAARILRPGGRLIVSEYHPFRRVWRWEAETLEIEYSYFDRSAHEYDCDPARQDDPTEPLVQYEYYWTVSDYVTAMLRAGCELIACEEYGEGSEDWERAPLAGLPRVLLLVGKKHD